MWYIFFAAAAIAADQWLKIWVSANIEYGTFREWIPGIVGLTNVHNYGAAFSIFNGVDAMRWIFVVVAFAVSAAAIWAMATKKIEDRILRWIVSAMIAGAIGNAIDRMIHGYVIDMFELQFMRFAVFNIADCFITCGYAALCIYFIFTIVKEKRKEKEKDDDC